jgi:hypothetical protein
VALVIADIAKADSRFFLKSEYGPLSDAWPAMSFSLPHLVTWLHRHYRPGQDFILYTGTSGPETREPDHRSRLLSLLTIDLMKTYRTEQLIPPASWKWAQEHYPGQWEYAFWVVEGWAITNMPLSHAVVPDEYEKIGRYPHRGMVVEITGEDRRRLLGLDIGHLHLQRQAAVAEAVTLTSLRGTPDLNAEAVRIANLVFNRVKASDTLQQQRAPERSAPSDLVLSVGALLMRTPLLCSLCGGVMSIVPMNRLLQPSPDRIDSKNGDYGPDNFQLVHLACNLAKNQFTVAEFKEWLTLASASVVAEQGGSERDD